MGVGERLKYARERAGLTGVQVTERTEIGASSLSDFENDKRIPNVSQLQKLAKTYRRSITFFLEEKPIPVETVCWRERPAEGAQEVETLFIRLCEQYNNLEIWCQDKSSTQLPEVKGDAGTYGYSDAEELAKSVRLHLQLGDRPGQVLLQVLEEACGIKIFHLDFQPTGTAASISSNTFGYGVLLNRGNVRWRRNHDLAHELFHLLTWPVFHPSNEETDSDTAEREEKLATCFARNLLMPTDALRSAINRRSKEGKVSLGALFDIAREFDVSIESLLWHVQLAFRSKGDSEDTQRLIAQAKKYTSLFEERSESQPPIWPERYRALAIKALRHGQISIGRCAEYLGISRQDAMKYIEQEVTEDEEVQISPV